MKSDLLKTCAASMLARRSPLLLSLLLLTITVFVFAHVCGQAFVDWDDPLHTYQNPFFTHLSVQNLAQFWRQPYDGLYIPVCYMAYAGLACLCRLPVPVPTPSGGMTTLNPHVFHTANLILHLGNVLLVFWLLRRLVKNDWTAFVGTLLFAVHPVQVETVAWISEMRGLLSNFFGLLALCGYLNYAQAKQAGASAARFRWSYALALAAFLLALLAKPSVVILPVLAWLLDVGVLRRSPITSLKALAGWLLAAAPIFWLTRSAQIIPPELNVPWWQKPLVAGDALAFYLSKLLVPINLGIDYGRTPAFVLHGASAIYTWAAPMLLAALVWRFRRSQPLLWIAFGLFVAALLPVLGFAPFVFQNFSTVADRYLYLALLGPALALACTLAHAKGRTYHLIVSGFLLICVCLSHAQVNVWDNSQTLFEHAIAVNPRSVPMHYDLGNAFRYRGEIQKSILQYQAAIEINPNCAEAYCNLGQSLVDLGDIPDGLVQVREALRISPRMAAGHKCLGTLLARTGDWNGAMREWQEALQIVPTDTLTRYNVGCVLFQHKHVREARVEFETVLRLDPDNALAQHAITLINHRKAS